MKTLNFWEWIITEHQKHNRILEIEINGIIYDKNFYYNPTTNILTAESSKLPLESIDDDCNLLEKLANYKMIRITIR